MRTIRRFFLIFIMVFLTAGSVAQADAVDFSEAEKISLDYDAAQRVVEEPFTEDHFLYKGNADKIYAVRNYGSDVELKLRMENLSGKVEIDIYDQDKSHIKNMTAGSDFEYSIPVQEEHTYYFRISLANGVSGADSMSAVGEKNTIYRCEVRNDYYPGYANYASFSIRIENYLAANSGEWKEVLPGTEVIMRANASCRNGNLHYTWIDEGIHAYTDDDQVLPESGDTLKRIITKDSRFTLKVRDDYGNQVFSHFEYTVRNTVQKSGLRETYYLKKGAQISIGDQSLKADSYKWTVHYSGDSVAATEYPLDHNAPVLKIKARSSLRYTCVRTVGNSVIEDVYNIVVDDSSLEEKKLVEEITEEKQLEANKDVSRVIYYHFTPKYSSVYTFMAAFHGLRSSGGYRG